MAKFKFNLLFSKMLPTLAMLVILPIWEISVNVFDIPSFLLPAPSAIYQAFVEVETSRWSLHIWATLRVALLGFCISLLISLPLAILMVKSRFLAKTLYPVLVIIQSTPVVAIAPLLVVILGAGEAPRLTITCLITFFPLVVSATTGMMSAPEELLELSRSLKASAAKEVWHIRLPYAVPHIFSGMKVAITLAIIGAVVAEFVAAEQGLGYFVQFSTSYFKIPQAFAALVILSTLSLLLFKTVQLTQYVFFRWSLPKDKF